MRGFATGGLWGHVTPSVGSGGWAGCKPCVDSVLQDTAAAIVQDRLTVRKVDAGVFGHGMASVEIVDCGLRLGRCGPPPGLWRPRTASGCRTCILWVVVVRTLRIIG